MKKFISLVMTVVLLIGLLPATAGAAPKELKVHFIDVGQGDAILVQAPGGKNMLVDGGPKSAGDKVVKFLKAKGVKRLDYVVATHPDADHIGGLEAVLNAFPVTNFVDSGYPHTTQTYYNMLSLIDKKNIKFTVAKELDKLALDPQMVVRVLYADENAKDSNDASIVLKLTYNKVSFLLMADANTAIEDKIRAKYDVTATVLKNGHHGSNTSSSAAFISSVKPSVGILSYGKNNSYGHPHAAIEARLKNVGATTYKTAVHCDITVTTNGVKHSVSTGCGSKATAPAKPAPKPATKPAPKPAAKPAPTQTNFKNCTELRKVYPKGVSSGHPAYQSKMDRDKDGWACER
ncbi:predicted hydrolase [Bacillus sp. OxB-1]|uniref:MBL fold metallo-hydrolase n=1 Tax=Bacillus sp. (strain OxB-1) TaxID=98228 RepID=UPI000581E85B|nr:MBL fold metallo-hydrolase [Bacillus sp. OxB-1]BAQ11278.1 predicted hydrolase [Bacillus sp. OxB-1]